MPKKREAPAKQNAKNQPPKLESSAAAASTQCLACEDAREVRIKTPFGDPSRRAYSRQTRRPQRGLSRAPRPRPSHSPH